MILYALKSALVLMLLYTCFFALTSRETFHRLNRVLLVGTLALALVVPSVQMTVAHPLPVAQEIVNFRIEHLEAVPVAAQPAVSLPWWQTVSWPTVVALTYYLGLLVMLLLFLVQHVQLALYLRDGLRHTDEHGNTVVLKTGNIASFSIFRTIVMSVDDYEHNRSSVLRHEQEHIRLHHTYDLLLLELVKILQWFNPFVWLLGRDLRAIHEYEADEAVIKQGIDARQYQLLLVTKAVGYRLQPLANNLSRGSLKKRMIMMYQKKSSRTTMLKALFVLPITALSLYAFATPEVQSAVTAIDKADPTTKVVEKVVAPVAEVLTTAEPTIADKKPIAAPEVADTIRRSYETIVKSSSIAEALNTLEADENTLYIIDKKVVSRKEFLDWAKNITNQDIRGTGIWHGAKGLAVSEVGEVANDYDKVIKILTKEGEPYVEGHIYLDPAVAAQYPGGDEALMMQLAQTLHYPTYAMEKNICGKVILRVVVEKDGSIGAIKVQKGLEERCDAEAVLAVSKLDKFIPAQQQGKPVASYVIIPVFFRLQ